MSALSHATLASRPGPGRALQNAAAGAAAARPGCSARVGRLRVCAAVEAEKKEPVTSGGCPGCGRAEVKGGCNGEGRIMGGLGAVPGFGWWPIKAYRPCPAFLEAGGTYRRQGQSLDEVAFGRRAPDDDLLISERLEKLADSDMKGRLKKLKEEEDKSKSSTPSS